MLQKLTDALIRNSKPGATRKRLSDGGGLYLEIAPAGGKWWRLKYRFGGKEKRISFGVYPEVSLKDAREKLDVARKQLLQGIDPGEERKAIKTITSGCGTFEAVAREWHAKFAASEWSASHAKNILSRLEKNVFPWLGARPVGDITSPEILETLRLIEGRGHLETLHRTLTNCGQVFRYAIATSRATIDPTYKMGEAFPKPIKHHFAAMTDPQDVALLLRAINDYHGTLVVKSALQLAPLVFLRPKELRLAEWAEFDLDKGEWVIPISRMKRTRRDKESKPKEVHVVPLSKQAVDILKKLALLTGGGRLVFPSERGTDRAISDAALTNALRRMGYGKDEMQIHGFRAMARTMLRQKLNMDPEWIERQLSHSVKGPLGKAYHRTTFLPERKKMMQAWADYLERLEAGSTSAIAK